MSENQSDQLPPYDEATEVAMTGDVLERLLRDDSALPELEEAMHTGDVRAFRAVLERHELLDHASLVCRWICSWHVQRRCLWVCRDHEITRLEPEEVAKASLGLARLAQQEGALERLVDALDSGDGDRFGELLERFDLHAYCRLICVLILTVRCELFCLLLSGEKATEKPRPLVAVLSDIAGAAGKLAEDDRVLTGLLAAYQEGRYDEVHAVLEKLQLVRYCRLVCWWLCVVVPFLRCTRVCFELPIAIEEPPRPGDPGPIREWAKVTVGLAGRPEAVRALVEAARTGDDGRFTELVRELDLGRYCHYLCWWTHRLICYRRCFFVCPPLPPRPVFYRLGGYPFPGAVDTTGSGLTVVESRAFHGDVRLNGSALQQTYDGGSPEYRFEALVGGSWTPVLPGQIAPTVIGSWTSITAPARDYVVNGNAADPDVIVVSPDGDGWIKVPTENSFWTATGAFTSNGNFIRVRTDTVVQPTPVHDASAVSAGDAVPAAELGADAVVGLRMRWRRVGTAVDGLVVGTAERVAVMNDRWNQVAKGGSWLGTRADGRIGVVSVGVDEIGPGCLDVDDDLHVRYTAAHPHLGSFGLSVVGPVPVALTVTDDPTATAANRHGVATLTPPAQVADLPECSYLATLSVSFLLTDGDNNPGPEYDQVAFHVQH